MKKSLIAFILASLIFAGGCGTLFHSDRLGQKLSTQIDRSVWVGNVVLGLFGIIPGVVGFILDYSNGTIYYSEAELIPDNFQSMRKIETDGDMSCENVARLLSVHLHRPVSAEQVRRALNHRLL